MYVSYVWYFGRNQEETFIHAVKYFRIIRNLSYKKHSIPIKYKYTFSPFPFFQKTSFFLDEALLLLRHLLHRERKRELILSIHFHKPWRYVCIKRFVEISSQIGNVSPRNPVLEPFNGIRVWNNERRLNMNRIFTLSVLIS